jgi:hypothetical protein
MTSVILLSVGGLVQLISGTNPQGMGARVIVGLTPRNSELGSI